jgi:hypothetical protein
VSLANRIGFLLTLVISVLIAAMSHAEPMRVLWWDVSLVESRNKPANRETMARYVQSFKGGARFRVDYMFEPRRGAFARHMQANPGYQIVIVTAANNNGVFNSADLDAFRAFYASGYKTLMLDGTLGIRNSDVRELTKWPGVNRSSANMLINQMEALRKAGGGLFIGTDHGRFQRSANQALGAILPRAQFSRVTNPSRDGDFFGDLLLAEETAVKPLDMLRHWEAIPNQGQAPVGTFTDFLGMSVTLHALIEAADKPGGGVRRPYISSTIDPGSARVKITEDAPPVINRMPTRKSLPAN